jgi:hypothetical protein
MEAGYYYAAVELQMAGGLPGSQVSMIDLRPVVGQDGEPVEPPQQFLCHLKVPTLNIRSGPGLQYEIIDKVRGAESEPGAVLVVGRDPGAQWLAVDERIARGGWVTSNPDFILCQGDINVLPITEVSDGRLATAPAPSAVAPAVPPPQGTVSVVPSPVTPASSEESDQAATPQAGAPALSEDQALLIIHNSFHQQIRFTLDQQYRPEIGPSEYDLQPGASVTLVVYPGQLTFTASSPWNGLSDNAVLYVDKNSSQTLWLRFSLDPDGSGGWILEWQ